MLHKKIILVVCAVSMVIIIIGYNIEMPYYTTFQRPWITSSDTKQLGGSIKGLQVETPLIVYKNKTRTTNVYDIMFTIKSSNKFYKTRLKLLLETWIAITPNQVYVITDTKDENYTRLLPDGHFIESNCPQSHGRRDLCCKMGHEIKTMQNLKHKYRWFCRADDDTYYNQYGLTKVLANYDWWKPHILGKSQKHPNALHHGEIFMYPVGNAGVCMSRAVIDLIHPHTIDDKFERFCLERTLNDDVALGVIAYLYGRALVEEVSTMYGHGEHRRTIARPFSKIATINYRERKGKVTRPSVEKISPVFNLTHDPTRLRSLHCHIHPELPQCSSLFP